MDKAGGKLTVSHDALPNGMPAMVTFAVMLVTALTTTHFTSILRQRAQEAVRRERQTQTLYQLAKQLAGSLAVLA